MPVDKKPPRSAFSVRLPDGRVIQGPQPFQFSDTETDKLMRLVELDGNSSRTGPYIDELRAAVQEFQMLSALIQHVPDMSATLKTASHLHKSAAALIEQLSRLGTQDVTWLSIIRESMNGPLQEVTAPTNTPAKPVKRNEVTESFDRADRHHETSKHQPELPDWIQEQARNLQVLHDISQSLASITLHRPRGPKAKAHIHQLASRIADTFDRIISCPPTTTRGGAFEETLRLCLRAAGEYVGDSNVQKDLHAVATIALAGRKLSSN